MTSQAEWPADVTAPYPLAMYADFFGLKHEPFSIAPDPRYLFLSERHREALAHLLYGLKAGGGFVVLTGEIGTGKTTVCRCCLEQVPRRCNVAYVFNPKLTVLELLGVITEEFGITVSHPAGVSPSVKDYLDPLNAYLLRTHAVGQNNVLIIDEAQNLSTDVLEQLRLLTNLETVSRKLLQIVLIGQPELRDMLARPQLEQLSQRVIARYHLGALTEQETVHYIRHRLAVSGLSGAMPFDREARRRVHQLARGVPRRINLICDRTLLGAYGQGRRRIDRAMVDRAAREVLGEEGMPPTSGFERLSRFAGAREGVGSVGSRPRFGWWMAVAALACSMGLAALMTLHTRAPAEPPASGAASSTGTPTTTAAPRAPG